MHHHCNTCKILQMKYLIITGKIFHEQTISFLKKDKFLLKHVEKFH